MNTSRGRWLLVVIGTVLWVLVIYPAYYVVHKPLTTAQLLALANVAGDLFTWLAMLVVATALGSRLTRRLGYRSLIEKVVFSAGLGLLCFSVLIFCLGLVGLLYGWLFWILLIGGSLALHKELFALAHAFRQIRWPRPHGAWPVFLGLFIVATLLLAFPLALVPPTNWDSLLYHLVGPERYLQAHRITFEFDNYLLFAPALTEMLFTLGMGLKSDVLPRLVQFGYLLLTLGALGAFAIRFWERRLGLLAIALFLSVPTAVEVSTRSYADFALAFYTFAALYALLNWLSQRNTTASPEQGLFASWGWLVVAGLFCGAAASVKYNGVMCAFMLGALLAWEVVRRRLSARHFLHSALVLAALTLVVAAPWYIKNIIVTGNPIYPMAWGGHGINDISARWLEPAGPKDALPSLLILPWRLTVLGTQGTVAYDATFSPLFLLLLPLLLVVHRQAQGIGQLLLASAVGYASWIASGVIATGDLFLNGRWLLPILVPLSLLCAYSLEGMRIWDRESFSLRRVLMILTGLTLAFGLLSQMILTVGLNPWPYLVGHQSRDEYQNIYSSQRYHQAITYLNENLTADDKVFFYWEPRSYGIGVPHKADPLLDNLSQYLDRYGSAEEVIAGLQQEGFTHVMVNDHVYPWILRDFPITEEEQAAWERLQQETLNDDNLIHVEGEYQKLYRLPTKTEP